MSMTRWKMATMTTVFECLMTPDTSNLSSWYDGLDNKVQLSQQELIFSAVVHAFKPTKYYVAWRENFSRDVTWLNRMHWLSHMYVYYLSAKIYWILYHQEIWCFQSSKTFPQFLSELQYLYSTSNKNSLTILIFQSPISFSGTTAWN